MELRIPVFKEIKFAAKPYHVVPCASGGFLVMYRNSALVSRFDADYNLLWEQKIGDRLNTFDLTISSDGSMIGVSGRDFVRIFDGKGQLLFDRPHFPREIYQSSECYFHTDDRGRVNRILFFEPFESGEGFFQMFDAADFSLLKSLTCRDMDNHFIFHSTTDPYRILINLHAGQDGSRVLLAMLVNNNILYTEQEQCADLSIGNFSPSGDEYVTIDDDGQYLRIYSFPNIEQIAALDSEEVFTDDDNYPGLETDSYEYIAYYLSDKHILVRTRFGRLLLVNRDPLQQIGELMLKGCAITGYDDYGKPTSDPDNIIDYASEAEQVFLTGTRDLLVIHKNGSINVYKLPDLI
ncbi:MAG: hypothetical protein J7621_24790 [Niastella sp.]|nr:hypothetical protein [Niastella sp.]